jgi:hypothetical protein
MRAFLKRLEHAAKDEEIVIPQKDGTVKRFPKSASREALINATARLGAGADAPPEHPLIEAVRNSDDPSWAGSFFASVAAASPSSWTEPIEDLSEP